MLNRVRDKLGLAGLIVACVALVAALGGSAVAANSGGEATASAKGGGNVNKLIKREARKFSKRFSAAFSKRFAVPGPIGPVGFPGAPGADGSDGDDGSDGSDGSDGTDGKSVTVSPIDPGEEECEELGGAEVKQVGAGSGVEVCNGETGFSEVLPSGKTETGSWGMVLNGAGNGLTAISFNIPLAEGLSEANVHLAPEPTNCPGTAEDPQAAAGHLCVYQASFTPLAPAIIKPESAGPAGGTSKSGALLFRAGGPADTPGGGTWAVTAP